MDVAIRICRHPFKFKSYPPLSFPPSLLSLARHSVAPQYSHNLGVTCSVIIRRIENAEEGFKYLLGEMLIKPIKPGQITTMIALADCHRAEKSFMCGHPASGSARFFQERSRRCNAGNAIEQASRQMASADCVSWPR